MIHLLPGMGADERMFPGPWRELEGVSFVRWPKALRGKTVGILAEQVMEESGIKDGDVLAGSSLGGIVACEITKRVNISRLFLIGSAKDPKEIDSLLRFLHPLAGLAPLEMIRHFAGKIPSDLTRMFHDSDPEFIRAMCQAVFQWEGLGRSGTRILRVHGRQDPFIPLPPDVDLVLEGGHLIAMTHAQECVAFVRQVLA